LPDAGTTLPTSTIVPGTTTTIPATTSTAPGEPVPLEVWVLPDFAGAFTPAADAFTAATGIPVTVEAHTLDTVLGVAGSPGPDLFMAPHTAVGDLVTAGAIAPIELGARSQGFHQIALAAVTYDGALRAVPVAMDAAVLLSNPSLLERVPAGFAEIEELCRSLADAACVALGASPAAAYPFISAAGGYLIGTIGSGPDPSDIGIDGDGAKSGAEFFSSLVDDGTVDWIEGADGALLVATGDAALTFGGAAQFQIWNGIVASELPIMEGRRPTPLVEVTAIFVNSASERLTEAALLLVDYLTATGALQSVHDELRLVPVHADVVALDSVAPFLTAALAGSPAPSVPGAARVLAVFEDVMQRIANGAGVGGALDEAATEIRALFPNEG
jgi:maltose-binding protein MalE